MLFCSEGLWPSKRGQDARDTQGRDAPRHAEDHCQSFAASVGWAVPTLRDLAYLKTLIERVGLDVREGTMVCEKSEQRRQDGTYQRRSQT